MDDDAGSQDWADLADLLLTLAREIQGPGYRDRRIVPLTSAEAAVMRFVDRNPGSTLGEVASATGFQRSNLSTLVSSLAGRGLVEKRGGSADGRVIELHPTREAGENLARLRAEWTDLLADAAQRSQISSTTDETIELLGRLLEGVASRRRDSR
ncbi:MarR family winged helix-turn-helix transcriptional regulator [Cnuibacter physcomitrellae]|uniref:MarR family winged helix-turn-helix transcriptional regulator n=1 Tax=Cnuibacter physcomitrellae TaxID=1619308 RepID=UPI002175EF2C|nr:MarR family winged helix-turn-helix transcriptional regulator [Cnuibacter physcomitrellae]MCS5497423.1 MarR family winged helix-turn-helix transcriptional regulator [Cnuibacter physcomitrellae]